MATVSPSVSSRILGSLGFWVFARGAQFGFHLASWGVGSAEIDAEAALAAQLDTVK